ncbi:MAG: aspartate aminotransferase family protein [Firmicutes bacterium]|nr:aspartate aminotransferase family protein [Bacillota bacterium]
MNNQGWLRRRQIAVAGGINSAFPVFVDRAEGNWVVDVEGHRYLDFIGGIGVQSLGHNRPEIVSAIQDALDGIIHTSFHTVMYPRYVEVSEQLAALVPGPWEKQVAFFNSGAEAVENALKIARQYTGKPGIISFNQGFHGRTYGALSATDKTNPYKVGFGPFIPDVYRVPSAYCYRCPVAVNRATCQIECLDMVQSVITEEIGADQVAALIIEPEQGEGGFIPMPGEFLRGLRHFCTQHQILFIADEIQAGLGRTGKMWSIEHSGVAPDLLVTAKALGGGLPLSAVVGRRDILAGMAPGSIGSTYGGNPVALAAAKVVLNLMAQEDIPGQAAQMGNWLRSRALEWQAQYPQIGDVRGLGAMIGLEFVHPGNLEPDRATCQAVIQAAFHRGLLLTKAGLADNVIRLLPPLTISRADAEDGMNRLESAINDVLVR